MDKLLKKEIKKVSQSHNLKIESNQILELKSNKFDKKINNTINNVVKKLGYSSREIVSGAGHDAVNINSVAPTSMIFIPCIDGISHNESENVLKKDVTKGAEVLLHSIINLADN